MVKTFPNRQDPSVILFVAKGGRPPKPVSAEALGLNAKVWELRNKMWPRRKTILLPNASAAEPGPQNKETFVVSIDLVP